MAKKGKAKATTRKQPAPKGRAQASSRTARSSSDASAERKASTSSQPSAPVRMPFSRMNYILMAAGVGIIALGFILMSFDKFVDATQFSVSLYIAPPVVIFGFLSIIYAIMYQDKKAEADLSSES